MVALAPKPRLRFRDQLTVWTETGTYRGKYLGFDMDTVTTYLVLLEFPGREPRRIPWRSIRRCRRESWGGKRHVGGVESAEAERSE